MALARDDPAGHDDDVEAHRSGRGSRAALALMLSGLVAVSCAGAPSASPAPPPSASASPPVPVSPASATVLVFFGRTDLDPCTDIRGVERTVAEATPEAALRALVAGPTPAEVASGLASWFSAATADALISVTVADRTADVSLHDLRQVIPNASSSCGSSLLLSTLDATVLQFPGIDRVRYSFGGDEAAFYEWLQRGVPAP
jgi:hypothetical protein